MHPLDYVLPFTKYWIMYYLWLAEGIARPSGRNSSERRLGWVRLGHNPVKGSSTEYIIQALVNKWHHLLQSAAVVHNPVDVFRVVHITVPSIIW
jgi:hypothetical protein